LLFGKRKGPTDLGGRVGPDLVSVLVRERETLAREKLMDD
jgi:hypothetical protein